MSSSNKMRLKEGNLDDQKQESWQILQCSASFSNKGQREKGEQMQNSTATTKKLDHNRQYSAHTTIFWIAWWWFSIIS